MKYISALLPLAAITTAFVIPDEQLTNQILIESKKPSTFFDRIQGDIDSVWAGVESTFKGAKAFSTNALDKALSAGNDAAETFECHVSMTKFAATEWLESAEGSLDAFSEHHPPHHRKPNRPPHHDPHHHAPNKTVYELIASSKYTTKLAKLINDYPDLVKVLNGTAANYTVFAPTDEAFEKIPKGHKKPSKELIKKVLSYHVSPDFYPAGRVLSTHTIGTSLGEDALGGAQRLRVGFSLGKGLNINFYSKIVAVNIFGTNGVIHGIDSLLLPPPPATKIIELLPGEFSTLNLALEKTGLFELLEDAPHVGGTLFAPSNWAFQKLGPRVNAFLFSSHGQKYLKALLKYHVVANQTLYSDAFYRSDSTSVKTEPEKGHFHVDLPTLLDDKSLSIDVARWGGWITMKINGFNSVSVQDGIAKDGVIHVVSSVLIPPKTPGGASEEGEEIEVEKLMDRLIPFVQEL